jgi:hypothetical protein
MQNNSISQDLPLSLPGDSLFLLNTKGFINRDELIHFLKQSKYDVLQFACSLSEDGSGVFSFVDPDTVVAVFVCPPNEEVSDGIDS